MAGSGVGLHGRQRCVTIHDGARPVPAFPIRSLLASLAVTLLLVTVLAWRLWSSYLGILRAAGEDFDIQRLSGDVVHLDEVLTMSARMAAATGDPHWEERYRVYEPQLDAIIKKLMQLASESSMRDAAGRTNSANLSLVEMEHQAFDLVLRGHREEAINLLTGEKYDGQKRLYAQGAQEIIVGLHNRAEAVLRSERRAFQRVSIFALAALPIVLFLWLGVLRGVRRHIAARKRAEQAVREMAAFPNENPYPVLRVSRDGTLLYANRASDPLLEDFGGGTGEPAPGILAQAAARSLAANVREEFDLECRGQVFSFLATPIAEQNYVNLYGRDVTERRQAIAALRKIEWLLQGGRLRERDRDPKSASAQAQRGLVELNGSGELLTLVGGDVLKDIAGDYLDLLETSTAIYEKNGEYALGIFSSEWCRLMDQASRGLGATSDNREAMASGSGQCHRSCWDEASKIAMDESRPVDIECLGGIRIYALPIFAGGEVVGSINFGYGDPPRDPAKLKELAERFGVAVEELERLGASYESRPPFIVDAAKRRLATSARLIGEIVERRRAEQQMKAAKEAAEAANSAKDRFLAVLSHELRTPLTPVLINASVMESDERLPEEVRAEMGLIRRSLELEARLIDDLLDLNRIAQGKLQFRFAELDAHAKLQNVLDVCRTEAQEKGVRVACDLDAQESYVSGDSGRVQQVFWNLIKNAIKFTPPGGHIRVRSLNPRPGQLRVEIADTGIGIAPELMPQLFNAFEQGGPVITRQFGGLGLGLAISKALVEMHGGAIRAESEGPGRGATLTLELPTIPAPAPEPPQPVQPSYTSALRILLVEDHAITREVLRRALTRVGHQVETASDVRSALALIASSEFDVLVSDLGLPDASGLDLMSQLRSSRPDLVGLALSGYGTEEDIRRSKEAGFAEHLTKPVELNVLRATIEQVVGSRASGV